MSDRIVNTLAVGQAHESKGARSVAWPVEPNRSNEPIISRRSSSTVHTELSIKQLPLAKTRKCIRQLIYLAYPRRKRWRRQGGRVLSKFGARTFLQLPLDTAIHR